MFLLLLLGLLVLLEGHIVAPNVEIFISNLLKVLQVNHYTPPARIRLLTMHLAVEVVD